MEDTPSVSPDVPDHRERCMRLLRTHGDAVYAAAYRITRSPEDAEDILQEVFLRLLHQETRMSPTQERWDLYRRKMAINASIDLVRKRTRQQNAMRMEPLTESLQARQPQPDEVLIHKELAEQIRWQVTQLPEMEATVFVLRHLEGLSYQDIAVAVGSTKNAVGVALHSARQKLRRRLAEGTGKGGTS